MLNLMIMCYISYVYVYISFVLLWTFGQYTSWADLVWKITIAYLRWNLIPRLIQICWIWWSCLYILLWTANTLLSKFILKNHICLFKIKFGTETTLNMLNSMVMFIVLFWTWNTLFCKFGPKNRNYLFQLKFSTWINLNMLNSMVMFTFSS